MENFNNTTNVSDAGFNDILVGTELYRNLQLSPADLDDNITFSKIRDIAEFLNNHPDPIFVVNSVLRSNKNPQIKQLDHLWGYVELNNQKSVFEGKIKQLEKELEYYG